MKHFGWFVVALSVLFVAPVTAEAQEGGPSRDLRLCLDLWIGPDFLLEPRLTVTDSCKWIRTQQVNDLLAHLNGADAVQVIKEDGRPINEVEGSNGKKVVRLYSKWARLLVQESAPIPQKLRPSMADGLCSKEGMRWYGYATGECYSRLLGAAAKKKVVSSCATQESILGQAVCLALGRAPVDKLLMKAALGEMRSNPGWLGHYYGPMLLELEKKH